MLRRRGLSPRMRALTIRYADALWRDPPDLKTAPAWALRPWLLTGDSTLDGAEREMISVSSPLYHP